MVGEEPVEEFLRGPGGVMDPIFPNDSGGPFTNGPLSHIRNISTDPAIAESPLEPETTPLPTS